jgi:hypothetical protein
MKTTKATLLTLAIFGAPAAADLDFTQTFDGWWENKYEWDAQTEDIVCERNFEPKGTVKSVWARVVQKNGSKAGTPVFCTTMTKTASGLADTWRVNVPAGMICDEDFWDASVICVEIVKCDSASRLSYRSQPSPFGQLIMQDLPGDDLAIDPTDWIDELVQKQGFDMAVYAYKVPGQPPIILNHVDPIAHSTFTYDQFDAFSTGQPYDPNCIEILGINLDPNWDIMPKISLGLDFFEWQLFPGGGLLITDQGQFFIDQVQPLVQGWEQLCPADLNGDGNIDFFDVSEFLTAYNLQNPIADFNGDGLYDFFDVSAFLNAYNQGCP